MSAALHTLAEQSGFTQTGRLEEVDRLCLGLAQAWPDAVRRLEFGRSAEGRSMLALLVSRAGIRSAQDAHARGIPVLLIQAGIHPGESDGKDAGFIELREMLSASGAADPLRSAVLLFVPAFNADGHERVGRWNRPNQNGPEATGWRTTAQNLNLNRDYTKADAPEMQALLALIREWDPLICADLHVTDGADFEPDVSIQVEPINQGDPSLRAAGVLLRDELIGKLARQGAMPLPFYPDLYETDNPESGFVLTVYSPRFSTGYFPQRNRFTVLVETHSWKPYETRVTIMRNSIRGILELALEHGRDWLAKTRAADVAACALGGSSLTLDYRSGWREPTSAGKGALAQDTGTGDTIDFRGYAYTRTLSDISASLVTEYDPATPRLWRVPYRSRIEPTLIVRTPALGYFIPAAYEALILPRLECHGIITAGVPPSWSHADAQQFRASSVLFSRAPFEGRQRATLSGHWEPLGADMPSPSRYVPIAQPLARLVAALFEPQAPDSFAAWGFFNACFEQKEQLEPYVAEQIAREMLAAQPELNDEFKRRLNADATFAEDPVARLEFFWRGHASWDVRYNCYPIYRA